METMDTRYVNANVGGSDEKDRVCSAFPLLVKVIVERAMKSSRFKVEDCPICNLSIFVSIIHRIKFNICFEISVDSPSETCFSGSVLMRFHEVYRSAELIMR